MNIKSLLEKKVYNAFVHAGSPRSCEVQIRQSSNTQFGDYQVNGAMTIARKIGINPRCLAEKVVNLLDLEGIAKKINITGPGFINIFLDSYWIEAQINKAISLNQLNITPIVPKTIIVDYSSPNIAKEMHVGHMRSTIVGDAIVRTLEFLGHKVIRANHIGDWGTQFGMLIAYLEKTKNINESNMNLSRLEDVYHASKKMYDSDPEFSNLAHSYVVKLQNGDRFCRKIWKSLTRTTIDTNQKIYEILNVTLSHNDVIGESFYNYMLPGIVSDLKNKGLAIEIEGATIVFVDKFKNKEGKNMGVIIQKKDGAYLYATTDIACVKYRCETLHADRIIYYTDSRQHQHLEQVWTIVRKAGYVPKHVLIEHHMLGMVLNKDGKPFKTREGKTIKLIELLDEAIDRAYRLIIKKNPNMNSKEAETLSRIVGIGAIKYADLSKNRSTSYIFDWNSMLSFESNTAPYMQYAYTRVISIFKHSGENKNTISGKIFFKTNEEVNLGICLLQFEEAINIVARDGTPHVLCSYLYNIAALFSLFYEHCHILKANSIVLRQSRLRLCLLTSLVLKKGLDILGIEAPEKM